MAEIVIADLTSTRSRLFFSYIPALPFLLNAWLSGDVSAAVLSATTWQWGIGMWAIIYPVCTLPLIFALVYSARKAKQHGDMERYQTPFQSLGAWALVKGLFWQLDIVGVLLLIGVFGFILVPFTLASDDAESWKQPHIIAPLVIGMLTIPVFIVWEKRCLHPMVPFRLLRDRGVWGALGIAAMLNFAWYMQADYLYTVLQVAFDETVLSTTRIMQLYSFSSVITGVILSWIVFRVRRLKPFIVFGTCLFLVAFGVMIHFRGGVSAASTSGIIGGQVLLGIAGGLFPYPTQVSIQVATQHEHVAVITGLYLATYNIGTALGNAVSGSIWRQALPGQLSTRLQAVSDNSTLPELTFAAPLTIMLEYPLGTPERDAIIDAYRHVQWLLCITGACLCIPLIIFGLCLRSPTLTQEQSLENAEQYPSLKDNE